VRARLCSDAAKWAGLRAELLGTGLLRGWGGVGGSAAAPQPAAGAPAVPAPARPKPACTRCAQGGRMMCMLRAWEHTCPGTAAGLLLHHGIHPSIHPSMLYCSCMAACHVVPWCQSHPHLLIQQQLGRERYEVPKLGVRLQLHIRGKRPPAQRAGAAPALLHALHACMAPVVACGAGAGTG
jgi:hypothetical protein